MSLGHPAYPRPKGTGDQSMPEKRRQARSASRTLRETRVTRSRFDYRASCYPTSYPPSNEEALGQRAWVIRLTHGRKARGTRACRKSGGRRDQRAKRSARPA